MNCFRIRLRLHSPLGTPLVADTLFGHLCWGIAYHQGSSAVSAFLAATAGSSPPLVISDPLPADFWPMPVVPPPSASTQEALLRIAARGNPLEAHDAVRGLLRRAWLPHEAWSEVASGLDAGRLIRTLLAHDGSAPRELVAAAVAHNTIDRLSGRALETGGFFFDHQAFPDGVADYDVWTQTVYDESRVHELFDWALVGGYGRDAGTGKGRITVESVAPAALPTVERPNALMTLGTCAPAQTDPARGFWNLDVRHGKLGGAWAAGRDEESSAAFKYPVVLLARGAVLITDSPSPVVGRVVPGVHPVRSEVMTCGRTLALPIRVSEEVLSCLPIA